MANLPTQTRISDRISMKTYSESNTIVLFYQTESIADTGNGGNRNDIDF